MRPTPVNSRVLHVRWSICAVLVCTAGCEAPPGQEQVLPDSAALQPEELPVLDEGAPMLRPVDEADSSFHAFRSVLLDALARQDTAFLYSVLAPDIRNSFGDTDSIAGFRRMWRMDEPESPVWGALTRVLLLGGQMQNDSTFVAPYVFAFWPDSLDAFEHVAVVRRDAPLRVEPLLTSPAAGRLTHLMLRLDEWQNYPESGVPHDSTWARVTLPSGRSGWVSGSDVYSPVGWRAFFVRRADQWIMQFFVAGD